MLKITKAYCTLKAVSEKDVYTMQTKKNDSTAPSFTWQHDQNKTVRQHPLKTFLGKLKRAISTLSKTPLKSFLTLLWHNQLHHTFETMEMVQGTCIHIDASATWKACHFHFGVGGVHPGTFYKLWTNRSQWAFRSCCRHWQMASFFDSRGRLNAFAFKRGGKWAWTLHDSSSEFYSVLPRND